MRSSITGASVRVRVMIHTGLSGGIDMQHASRMAVMPPDTFPMFPLLMRRLILVIREACAA